MTRTTDWSDKRDKELVAEAQKGQEAFQGIAVEVMARLKASIDALRDSNDKYSRRLLWLNVILTVLTAVLTYKAIWP